ncbi:hypothetical protein PFLUV_G00158700 [Perca fluviatilis]|uniref:Uncharacterized protein n=1 Tax=Perca fluviatilis TaxID=8168 RepID=A0A6A5ELP2_PERFL|nr:hypothetical protein PFLUV_G00158700 [Perca fluviatilis]
MDRLLESRHVTIVITETPSLLPAAERSRPAKDSNNPACMGLNALRREKPSAPALWAPYGMFVPITGGLHVALPWRGLFYPSRSLQASLPALLIGLFCLWKAQCERGSPLDPSGGRACRCVREEGRCAAAEVIPEFKSAEVLCAPEQCVTATQQSQDPPTQSRISTQRRK